MAELRKCPFCGGEAEIWEDKVFVTFIPQCKECNAQRGRYINKENAIKAWNTRKPMEAVVAELEKLDENGIKCTDCVYNGAENCFGLCSSAKFERAISIVRGKE